MDRSLPSAEALRQACSFLFVPADQPARVAKALASGADMVIADWEDAVAPQAKPGARAALAALWPSLAPAQRARLLVRTNADGTPWHADDLQAAQALAREGLAGVVVPKAESAARLAELAGALGAGCALMPLIESVAGLDAASALAAAPQVARLAFGHLDFQVDAGMRCGADEAELQPVRVALVLAARRAGRAAPVDGVSVDLADDARLRADTERGLRLGFGGKLCIHPRQLATVHAVFAPPPHEVQAAERLLAAAEAARGGVCVVDGRMVDAPVLALARRTLQRQAWAAQRAP